jgi:hypothetical protein
MVREVPQAVQKGAAFVVPAGLAACSVRQRLRTGENDRGLITSGIKPNRSPGTICEIER